MQAHQPGNQSPNLEESGSCLKVLEVKSNRYGLTMDPVTRSVLLENSNVLSLFVCHKQTVSFVCL